MDLVLKNCAAHLCTSVDINKPSPDLYFSKVTTHKPPNQFSTLGVIHVNKQATCTIAGLDYKYNVSSYW